MIDKRVRAAADLIAMDTAFGRGHSVLAELAKAISLAQAHVGIEARVLCDNLLDMAKAIMTLSQAEKDFGFVYNETEETYDLSNGSCVRIVYKSGK